MSTKIPESHSLSIGSPDNSAGAEKRAEQFGSGEASTRPEQAELKIRVIKLKSVLLGNDGINIQYTWVEGGNPDASYTYTLPLEVVQKMVENGVCISSEGSNYSKGSTVAENLAKLRKFVKDQEKLRREREWDLLASTFSALSFPNSKNPTEVADEPNVSTRPEIDTVAAQTQTDSSEQEPDSDGIESQQTDSPEQEPDSGSIESQINETLIACLENENCYEGLYLIERFLISNYNAFESSSVSPKYIQLIANAILTIVDRGIQSQGLQFVNYFLMEAHACLGILDKAIDNTKSTQIPEQLKERLTNLFIRIRDEVVRFDYLVRNIHDISIRSSTPSEIIGPDNLSFLKLIYQKITERGSLVNEIIKEVFEKPFNEWVEANIARIKRIAESILQEVNEGTGTRYENLRSILINYKQDLSWDSWNGSVVREVLEECDRILETIR